MSAIDYTNRDFLRHPQKTLFQFATSGSIHHIKLPKIGQVALVSSDDALIDFLKSPHRFSTNPQDVGKEQAPSQGGYLPDIPAGSGNILFLNGKEHIDQKRKLDLALKHCGIRSFRPNIANAADALLENAISPKKQTDNERDLVSQFSQLLPALVMMELIGIPKSNTEEILKSIIQLTYPQGLFGTQKRKTARKKITEFLISIMRQETPVPEESLAAKLIEIDKLSYEDNAHLAFFTLMAGQSPASDLISLGSLTLIDHPVQLEKLQQDWTQAPSAVEEILRFSTPTHTTNARYALSEFDFHGHTFRKGDIAFGLLAASNMSPETNEAPLEFDIFRNQIRHISFGAGAHFCSGAQLTHIIAEIALQRLFSKWPNLTLSSQHTNQDPLDWTFKFGNRRLSKMMIQF